MLLQERDQILQDLENATDDCVKNELEPQLEESEKDITKWQELADEHQSKVNGYEEKLGQLNNIEGTDVAIYMHTSTNKINTSRMHGFSF